VGDWIEEYQWVFWWIGGISLTITVGGMLMVPWILARIPEDYFLPEYRLTAAAAPRHVIVRTLVLVLKNTLGILLLLFGIALLFLPGQGVLTILAGLVLMNFPGKRRLECWIVSRPAVIRPINWIRHRMQRPPLRVP
jgi:hypothetical protein